MGDTIGVYADGLHSHRKVLELQRIITAALLFLAATLAHGEEIPWYQVEIIIFERNDPAGAQAELWPDDPGSPPLNTATELHSPLDTPFVAATPELAALLEPVTPPEGPPPVKPFELLGETEFRLNDVMTKLSNSTAYRPLLHAAWRQPTHSRAEAAPVHIFGGELAAGNEPDAAPTPSNELGSAPAEGGATTEPSGADAETAPSAYRPEDSGATEPAGPDQVVPTEGGESAPLYQVDGAVTVSVERYLHARLDLLYRRSLPVQDPTLPPDAPEAMELHTFRLQTSRRMRSQELHYIDHPLFGVLVMVTPFELPQAEPEQVQPELPATPLGPTGPAVTLPARQPRVPRSLSE